MLWFLVLSTALGGKLADDAGFRGVKFGPASVLDKPPMSTCTPAPEKEIRWTCSTTVAEVPASVAYSSREGIFAAVLIRVEGYSNCNALKRVLYVAWGEPTQPNPYIESYYWMDDLPIMGSYRYNLAMQTCDVVITDMHLWEQADLMETERKARNSGL